MTVKKKKPKQDRKQVLKIMGIYDFIAIKTAYNNGTGSNYFYTRLKQLLEYNSAEHQAQLLRRELHVHIKEYAQYQN